MAKKQKKIKILFSGGGTGGSVSPLLAIADTLSEQKNIDYQYFWLGTKSGPEKKMLGNEFIFKSISSGKLRRYFSWKNFIDPFFVFIGFWQSLFFIVHHRPDIYIAAGSFTAVPSAWAAFFCRVPILIHQQDYRSGLANRLISPIAKVITVTFAKSLRDYGKKAFWVGNPIRLDFLEIKISHREAKQKFGFFGNKPIVLVLGGGTGADAINSLVVDTFPTWRKFCQILHVCGQGKVSAENKNLMAASSAYRYFEFLDVFGMIKAYALADLVVSRCGLSTLTELSILAKASILMPLPDSHQEDNAAIFAEANAALVLNEAGSSPKEFAKELRVLLQDSERQQSYSKNIAKLIKKNASNQIIWHIKSILEKKI